VDSGAYSGSARVCHLLGILRDDLGWPAVAARVQAPLKGQHLAAYYGCMLLRPRGEMQLDDPEAPSVMEDLLSALGAEVVGFSHATECCGSYLLVSQPPAAGRLSERIVEAAAAAGAGGIVTACPLCAFNLDRAQAARPQASRLPIVYFTQVMAAAFGLPEHAGPLAVTV
jgi:heterodisulfide reductase subunit B